MLTDSQAATLGKLVLYAMDQFRADPDELEPKPDPRLAGTWRMLGYLTASDTVLAQLMAAGETVCYGFLAQRVDAPNVYAAAIRGTSGFLEWVKDSEFIPKPHPVAGRVDAGFWGIYSSMEYRAVGAVKALPAAQGIAAAIGQGELIVLGHSLGSALATYLTFDLAGVAGARVQGCFFASPRPGDAAFAQTFHARVATYTVYNYELDVVPQVPFGLDYTDLPNAVWINTDTAKARIAFSLDCHHHLISYLAMLDYGILNWQGLPPSDALYAQCIKGPS